MTRTLTLERTCLLASTLSIAAGLTHAPATAHACGGFFCSAASPVNQAAEQIVFADNGDGTITAVIQILYQGPASDFAWVLPIPGSPKVAVSSESALDALKQATNPRYQLSTMFEGTCSFADGGSASSGRSGGGAGGRATGQDAGVAVVDSGAVGPYDYVVIEVNSSLESPEAEAIEWLTDNGYDVGDLGPEVLRPYLAEGLNLIAFKLQKGNDSGSIRPVMLTYTGTRPSIPIRPTAVAANRDMGVLVWVLAAARGVPSNYKALELNEALINWFNPMSNYNDVVSRAADEAMGQGFVTEFAGPTAPLLAGLELFPDFLEQAWTTFSNAEHDDALEMIQEADDNWGYLEGYDDALRAALTLPEQIAFDDFRRCAACYIEDSAVAFDTSKFLLKLYEYVIKPLADTEKLFKSRPYLTRLYTTMSAEEMTTDPVFEFNQDADDVSNVHMATRYVSCGGSSWRVEIEGAGTVSGDTPGVWPVGMTDQPAAMRILEFGTSGAPRVVEDRTAEIRAANQALTSDDGGTAGRGSNEDGGVEQPKRRGGGCSVQDAGPSSASAIWLVIGCAALLRRRARTPRRRG